MAFTVIDTKTGQYPDTWKIVCKEEWAKRLCYCDIEGFAVEEDGTLVLLDECGKVAYCPEGRFRIIPEPQWIPVTERLPEEGEFVLVYGDLYPNKHDGGVIAVSKRMDWNYWQGFGRERNITHWMPLPEPPKEAE